MVTKDLVPRAGAQLGARRAFSRVRGALVASEGREFGELPENEVSLHSPQEVCQGTSTPKPRPCDVELCLLRVSCQLEAGLVLGEATLPTESLKLPG